MKTLFRFFLIILAIIAIAILGAATFVRFYFTEDRVKTLVVTEGEKSLGRKLDAGRVSIGLFKGIEVENFAIKEEDNKTNFLSAKDITLKYDLFSLLDKKFLITSIIIDEPDIRIIRDKSGKFNYESMLEEKDEKVKKTKEKTSPKAAPLALIIDDIKVNRAKVAIRDELKEIPDTDAKGNLRLSISVGKESDIDYKGNLDLVSTSKLKSLNIDTSINADFDPATIKFNADVTADQQKLNLAGELKNWSKKPDLLMDVSGEKLDIERIIAIPSLISEGSGTTGPAHRPAPTSPKKGTKTEFSASGKVNIKDAIYQGLEIKNVSFTYTLEGDVLNISNFSSDVADGSVNALVKLDLSSPKGISFSGNADTKAVNLQKILAAIYPKMQGDILGTMDANATFSGTQGKIVNADANYTVQNASFKETPVISSIAGLLGLDAKNISSFSHIDGNLKVKDENLLLKSHMTGKDMVVDADGMIGLNGRLDLPLILTFSGDAASSLQKRASFTKYLSSGKDKVVLPLKLSGTVTKPYPTIEAAAATEQVKEVVKEKVFETIEKAVSGKKKEEEKKKVPQAEELIKGIFGR